MQNKNDANSDDVTADRAGQPSRTDPAKPRTPANAGEKSDAQEPIAPTISLAEFAKIDLRVARIVEAGYVEGADKLLCLQLELGGHNRHVFAGIKSAYNPEQLQGRLVIVVANLAPRNMRFGISEGMILAAGEGGRDIYLLSADDGAEPGNRVR